MSIDKESQKLLIQLPGVIDNLNSKCEVLDRKIQDHISKTSNVAVLENEISHLKSELEKSQNAQTWLLRTIFGVLFTGVGSLFVWLIQRQ